MAQALETPRKYFAPSAGTTELDYSDEFTAEDATYVKVWKNGSQLTYLTDYTVDITEGTVTLTTDSVADDQFGVIRDTDLSRATTFTNTGQADVSILDNDIDRIIRWLQEANDKIDNLCIRYDASVNTSDLDLTIPAAEDGGVLQFNSSGQIIAVVPD